MKSFLRSKWFDALDVSYIEFKIARDSWIKVPVFKGLQKYKVVWFMQSPETLTIVKAKINKEKGIKSIFIIRLLIVQIYPNVPTFKPITVEFII